MKLSSLAATVRRLQQSVKNTRKSTIPKVWKAVSSAPSNPESGQIYLDDGTNTDSGKPGFRYYNGTSWFSMGSGDDIYLHVDGTNVMDAPIDFGTTATLLNVAAQSSAPGSASTGYIYLDDGTNTDCSNEAFRIYNGSAWEDVGLKIVAGNGITLSTTVDEERQIVVDDTAVDHDQLTNTHNLTTDIDHDALTNYAANEHFTEASIDHGSISGLTDAADHPDYPTVYLGGSLRNNPVIMAGSQAITAAASVTVTLPTSYSTTTSYVPHAVKMGTSGTQVVEGCGYTANTNQFIIYMSASFTGTLLWITIGY